MIYYLYEGWRSRMAIDAFLASPLGSSWFWDVQAVPYEAAAKSQRLPRGVYIFSCVGGLYGRQHDRAVALWGRLDGCAEYTLLNNPARFLRRFELLRTLFDRGINSFNVYAADCQPFPRKFPVFLRRRGYHWGQRRLIHHQRELEAAIDALSRTGAALDHWMVVEFCDTRDADGLHHKFAAFSVQGEAIARHLKIDKSWVVKSRHDARFEEAELHYVRTNPHREQLEAVFALAHVDYGRMDYGLLDGRIQVWEINSNPMILTPDIGSVPGRMQTHQAFMSAFSAHLRRLTGPVWRQPPETPTEMLKACSQAAHVGWERLKYSKLGKRLRHIRRRLSTRETALKLGHLHGGQ